MLKRSLVLTLLFLAKALNAMDENPAPVLVVVAPKPQKVEKGLLAWLLNFTSRQTEETDASTKEMLKVPGTPPKMVYMSPEEEAKKARALEARDAAAKLYFVYPGGPLAPSSPEPIENQRCNLKISFGCNGCCP